MSVWKRWFAKPAGALLPLATRATCPFCGSGAEERAMPATAYPVWDSECGAIGSGSGMYPDLDEVADMLLGILGLSGSVSEPSVPTGGSGMVYMQHYDIPKSLDQLVEILRGCGFEMQTSMWNEAGHQIHCIWVRRAVA